MLASPFLSRDVTRLIRSAHYKLFRLVNLSIMLYIYTCIKTSKYFRTSSSSYVVIFVFLFFIFFYNFVLCIKKKNICISLYAISCRQRMHALRRFYVSRHLVSPSGWRAREHLLLLCLILDCVDEGRNDSWFTTQECSLYNEHAHVIPKNIIGSWLFLRRHSLFWNLNYFLMHEVFILD